MLKPEALDLDVSNAGLVEYPLYLSCSLAGDGHTGSQPNLPPWPSPVGSHNPCIENYFLCCSHFSMNLRKISSSFSMWKGDTPNC